MAESSRLIPRQVCVRSLVPKEKNSADSATFLPRYTELGIVKTNPFASLDATGVGQLMRIAVEKGRKARPDIKLGICGEHGGDPHSVVFCHHVGLDYVSCSPFRLPVARLAAAQAALGKTY